MEARSWAVAAGAALLLSAACAGAPPPKPLFDGPPLIVAHYMPWYRTPAVSGSWRHWAVNEPHIPRRFWHHPDRRARDGRRDVASVFYPWIGPYDSADPDLCEYHILLARLSGIDAFVADWYGPTSFEDEAFGAMRDAAERLGFKVMLCWEDQALFPPYTHASSRAQALEEARFAMHYVDEKWFSSSAYLRIGGRPALTNFAWGDPGPGMEKALSAAEWSETVLAAAGTRPVFLHDWQPHRKTNEFEPYESVMPWGSAYHMASEQPAFWEAARAALGRGRFAFLSGTVLPGFDNRGVGGWGAQGAMGVTPFDGGRKFQSTWDDALAHGPQVVQIATWNDFNEGSTVEPTRPGVALRAFPQAGYGYRLLEIVQENAAKLKGTSYDTAALRVPALIYACRKTAAAAGETEAHAAIDVARELLLAGRTAEARAVVDRIYLSFPARLRADPDLAVFDEPAPGAAAADAGLGWLDGWTVNDCLWRFQEDFLDDQRPPHPGRKMILGLHPVAADRPCLLTRRAALGPGARLTLAASSTTARPNEADFVLRVRIDGEVVHEEVVEAGPAPSPRGWKEVRVDLGRFAGREVEVAIEAAAGGRNAWNHEHAFLADVRLATD